ncbi:MAG: hypothetical protein HY220_01725 [Candidatus Sungbacteria bacterium]|uniref:Uncharacterized protein n=1 Tax=Candidatus Sungiibacteriota bacterium TaxID=2750080 RepID=A0A9D6LRG3_9BACT|nr:hypothetical protein [Candidatus Sungbacteria bacterium]
MNPIDYYSVFIDYLYNLPWGLIYFFVQVLGLLIFLWALYWYISTVKKMHRLSVTDVAPEIIDEPRTLPPEIVAQPWLEIQAKMASANPADWSIAVIQADGVLDQILKTSGYIGDTIGDRLKQIDASELASIDDVWKAHKIRNRLAHGGTGALDRREAEMAIAGYRSAFQELNYID